MGKRRVVVTGVGVISSLGIGIDKFWSSIKEGKLGISRVTRFEVSDLPTKNAAEVNDFNPNDFIDKKEVKRMDRYTQFAMAAAKMAIEHAKLDVESIDRERAGVIVGSGIGGIQTLEDQHQVLNTKGAGRISPFFIPMMISNMA